MCVGSISKSARRSSRVPLRPTERYWRAVRVVTLPAEGAEFEVSLTGGQAATFFAYDTSSGLPTAAMAATGASTAEMLEEGHSRLASPLLAVAAALLGFAALVQGSFSRFGLWRQMGLAVGLLIGVQLVWTWAGSVALQAAGAWPVIYLAPAAGIGVAGLLLAWAQRPRRLRGAAA